MYNIFILDLKIFLIKILSLNTFLSNPHDEIKGHISLFLFLFSCFILLTWKLLLLTTKLNVETYSIIFFYLY